MTLIFMHFKLSYLYSPLKSSCQSKEEEDDEKEKI